MKKTAIWILALCMPTLLMAQSSVTAITGKRIEVTKQLDGKLSQRIMDVIAPYKASVDSIVAPVLGQSEMAMSSGRPESLLGNWAADVMVEQCRRTFGTKPDMGIVNVGGLRNKMPKGTVRRGDIMLISPFENTLTMVTMKGADLLELMQNIAAVGGEAVSHEVQMHITPEGKLVSVLISGKAINPKKNYRIATIDYLAEGNDKMYAFKKAAQKKTSKVLAREAMMQSVQSHGTISSRMEGRIIVDGQKPKPKAEQKPASKPRHLYVMHTSDTHSCVEPISPNFSDTAQADKAGYMRRAALVAEERDKHPEDMLLLDCGDFSQGSVYYNLFKGEVEVKLMNEMGYDACAIGNHEFDFGLDNMARLFRMARFPIVCCNYDFTGTPCQGLVKPYVIIQRAGLKVGILGVAPKLDGLVAKNCYGDVKYTEPAKAAQPIIDLLRNQEHCDVVICLSHLGWQGEPESDKVFVPATHGIDLLLGGHSHTYFSKTEYLKDSTGRSVPVDHQGKNGRWIGTFDMEIAPK